MRGPEWFLLGAITAIFCMYLDLTYWGYMSVGQMKGSLICLVPVVLIYTPKLVRYFREETKKEDKDDSWTELL